jgi:hypothetical protein
VHGLIHDGGCLFGREDEREGKKSAAFLVVCRERRGRKSSVDGITSEGFFFKNSFFCGEKRSVQNHLGSVEY